NNRQLEALATQDGLTGLYNHRYFQEILARQFAQARRFGRPLSLIMLDIDRFKVFNDTYGHQFGDQVLKALAGILVRSVRQTDIVARYGGEEFSVLLVDTDRTGSALVAEKLRKSVEELVINRGPDQVARVTISLGVASMTGKTPGTGELIRSADNSLYEAKGRGRNRVVVSEDAS
ncbi:MAG: GGDEF domain-containing protein, partial [Acidobacteria bacterium]|nr:GGDEF domain-containing protein [Acidobacteriota bacterium]